MNSDAALIGMRRLYHQRISHPAFKDAAEVAAWMGAVQGQDYAGTKWAFGLRLPGCTDADIEQAFVDGVVMRTWAVRGTLHYVAPTDIHWILGLIAPRLISGNAGRYRELELDEPTLAHSTALIANALQDGQHLTRTELFTILQANGISMAGQRGFYMLQRAGLERLVYQAEMRGKDTTFRALEDGKSLPKDEALAELARRYFRSHGPVTVTDFAGWAGLPITEARTGLEAIRSELVEEKLEGQSYWVSAEGSKQPERCVYLLPGFDEYVLGYRDRSVILDLAFSDAICPGGNGMFTPTIVSDGRIVGTWKRTVKKKAVEISFETFRALSTDETDQLDAEAARYGAYLGLPVVMQQR